MPYRPVVVDVTQIELPIKPSVYSFEFRKAAPDSIKLYQVTKLIQVAK